MSGVILDVQTKSDKAQADLAAINNSLLNIQKTTDNAANSLSNMVKNLGAVITSSLSIKYLTEVSNTFQDMNNRIAQITGRTEQLGLVQAKILGIVKDTRGQADATVLSFQALGRAMENTGTSMNDILTATKSINMAMVVSGASAEAAKDATIQLGQALAFGALRGQDLRSVMEQAPRLAKVFADQMGVSVGKIRQMAEDGSVTTDIMFKGLLSQSDKLQEEFNRMVPTIGQAMSVLKQSIAVYTNEAMKGFKGTHTLGEEIVKLSNIIYTASDTVELTVSKNYSSFKIYLGSIKELFLSFSSILGSVGKQIIDALPVVRYMTNLSRDLNKVFDNMFVIVKVQLSKIGKSIYSFLQTSFNWDSSVQKAIKSIQEINFSLNGNTLLAYSVAFKQLATAISENSESISAKWGRFTGSISLGFKEFATYIGLYSAGLKVIGGDMTGLISSVADFSRSILGLHVHIWNLGTILSDMFGGKFSEISNTLSMFHDKYLSKFDSIVPIVKRMSSAIVNEFYIIRDKFYDLANSVENKSISMSDRVSKIIKNFSDSIIHHFWNIYDKVIGHSWWTDTMNGVVDQSAALTGRVSGHLDKFANYIKSTFTRIKDEADWGLFRAAWGQDIKYKLKIDPTAIQKMNVEISDFYMKARIGRTEYFKYLVEEAKDNFLKIFNSIKAKLSNSFNDISAESLVKGLKGLSEKLKNEFNNSSAGAMFITMSNKVSEIANQIAVAFPLAFKSAALVIGGLLINAISPAGMIKKAIMVDLGASLLATSSLAAEKFGADLFGGSFLSAAAHSMGVVVGYFVSSFIKELPQIINALMGMLSGFFQGFMSQMPFMIGSISSGLGSLVSHFSLEGPLGLVGVYLFGKGLSPLMMKFDAIKKASEFLFGKEGKSKVQKEAEEAAFKPGLFGNLADPSKKREGSGLLGGFVNISEMLFGAGGAVKAASGISLILTQLGAVDSLLGGSQLLKFALEGGLLYGTLFGKEGYSKIGDKLTQEVYIPVIAKIRKLVEDIPKIGKPLSGFIDIMLGADTSSKTEAFLKLHTVFTENFSKFKDFIVANGVILGGSLIKSLEENFGSMGKIDIAFSKLSGAISSNIDILLGSAATKVGTGGILGKLLLGLNPKWVLAGILGSLALVISGIASANTGIDQSYSKFDHLFEGLTDSIKVSFQDHIVLSTLTFTAGIIALTGAVIFLAKRFEGMLTVASMFAGVGSNIQPMIGASKYSKLRNASTVGNTVLKSGFTSSIASIGLGVGASMLGADDTTSNMIGVASQLILPTLFKAASESAKIKNIVGSAVIGINSLRLLSLAAAGAGVAAIGAIAFASTNIFLGTIDHYLNTKNLGIIDAMKFGWNDLIGSMRTSTVKTAEDIYRPLLGKQDIRAGNDTLSTSSLSFEGIDPSAVTGKVGDKLRQSLDNVRVTMDNASKQGKISGSFTPETKEAVTKAVALAQTQIEAAKADTQENAKSNTQKYLETVKDLNQHTWMNNPTVNKFTNATYDSAIDKLQSRVDRATHANIEMFNPFNWFTANSRETYSSRLNTGRALATKGDDPNATDMDKWIASLATRKADTSKFNDGLGFSRMFNVDYNQQMLDKVNTDIKAKEAAVIAEKIKKNKQISNDPFNTEASAKLIESNNGYTDSTDTIGAARLSRYTQQLTMLKERSKYNDVTSFNVGIKDSDIHYTSETINTAVNKLEALRKQQVYVAAMTKEVQDFQTALTSAGIAVDKDFASKITVSISGTNLQKSIDALKELNEQLAVTSDPAIAGRIKQFMDYMNKGATQKSKETATVGNADSLEATSKTSGLDIPKTFISTGNANDFYNINGNTKNQGGVAFVTAASKILSDLNTNKDQRSLIGMNNPIAISSLESMGLEDTAKWKTSNHLDQLLRANPNLNKLESYPEIRKARSEALATAYNLTKFNENILDLSNITSIDKRNDLIKQHDAKRIELSQLNENAKNKYSSAVANTNDKYQYADSTAATQYANDKLSFKEHSDNYDRAKVLHDAATFRLVLDEKSEATILAFGDKPLSKLIEKYKAMLSEPNVLQKDLENTSANIASGVQRYITNKGEMTGEERSKAEQSSFTPSLPAGLLYDRRLSDLSNSISEKAAELAKGTSSQEGHAKGAQELEAKQFKWNQITQDRLAHLANTRMDFRSESADISQAASAGTHVDVTNYANLSDIVKEKLSANYLLIQQATAFMNEHKQDLEVQRNTQEAINNLTADNNSLLEKNRSITSSVLDMFKDMATAIPGLLSNILGMSNGLYSSLNIFTDRIRLLDVMLKSVDSNNLNEVNSRFGLKSNFAGQKGFYDNKTKTYRDYAIGDTLSHDAAREISQEKSLTGHKGRSLDLIEQFQNDPEAIKNAIKSFKLPTNIDDYTANHVDINNEEMKKANQELIDATTQLAIDRENHTGRDKIIASDIRLAKAQEKYTELVLKNASVDTKVSMINSLSPKLGLTTPEYMRLGSNDKKRLDELSLERSKFSMELSLQGFKPNDPAWIQRMSDDTNMRDNAREEKLIRSKAQTISGRMATSFDIAGISGYDEKALQGAGLEINKDKFLKGSLDKIEKINKQLETGFLDGINHPDGDNAEKVTADGMKLLAQNRTALMSGLSDYMEIHTRDIESEAKKAGEKLMGSTTSALNNALSEAITGNIPNKLPWKSRLSTIWLEFSKKFTADVVNTGVEAFTSSFTGKGSAIGNLTTGIGSSIHSLFANLGLGNLPKPKNDAELDAQNSSSKKSGMFSDIVSKIKGFFGFKETTDTINKSVATHADMIKEASKNANYEGALTNAVYQVGVNDIVKAITDAKPPQYGNITNTSNDSIQAPPTISGDSSLNDAIGNINIPSGDFTAPLGMGDNSVQFKGLLDNVKNGSFDSMMNTKKTMSEFQVPNPADPKSVSTNFAQQKISDDAVASQNSNNDSNTNNLTKSLDSTNQAIGKIGSGAGSIGTLANDFGVSSNSGLGSVLSSVQTGVQAASAVTNLMGLFGAATGGYITGPGSGTSDSIPTMLSNGEFVINAKATQNSLPLLHAINNHKIPKFSLGGIVGNNNTIPTMGNASTTSRNVGASLQKSGIANKPSNVSTFHINVTGDISMQTRKEIQAMIPQIASGVNAQNRELGNMLTSY
jgi:tape measure domain-containing protein